MVEIHEKLLLCVGLAADLHGLLDNFLLASRSATHITQSWVLKDHVLPHAFVVFFARFGAI